jgi:hypothetical protein
VPVVIRSRAVQFYFDRLHIDAIGKSLSLAMNSAWAWARPSRKGDAMRDCACVSTN